LKIKWFEQAAFLFVAEAGLRIIADPYDPAIGYGDIVEEADLITISHEHRDHNYIDGIKGKPQALRGPGSQEAKGTQFNGIDTFHDKSQGSERGPNTVFCFSLDGVKICHLGDLGHILSDRQINDIGKVDLLLIPVGGRATIDPAEASELITKMRPRIVVPMHFKTEKAGVRFAEVDNFLSDKSNVKRLGSSEFEIRKADRPTTTQIVVLEHAG